MRVGVGGIRPPRSKSDRFFSVVAVWGLLALAASAATAAEAEEEAVIKAETGVQVAQKDLDQLRAVDTDLLRTHETQDGEQDKK